MESKTDLISCIKETNMTPVKFSSVDDIIGKDTRGRKPISEEKMRVKVRNELTRIFIKIEKEVMLSLPERGCDVKPHVINVARKVTDNL